MLIKIDLHYAILYVCSHIKAIHYALLYKMVYSLEYASKVYLSPCHSVYLSNYIVSLNACQPVYVAPSPAGMMWTIYDGGYESTNTKTGDFKTQRTLYVSFFVVPERLA